MVQISRNESQGYNSGSGGMWDANSYDTGFSTKSAGEHTEACEKAIEKVHSILKSLDILVYKYDDELNELKYNILEFRESIRWNQRKVSNFDDDLSMSNFKSEEKRLKIKKLEFS